MSQESVRERLQALSEIAGELPHPPDIVFRAIEMCKDPAASATDLARLVMQDASATMKLLQIANSAFYSLSRRVATVTQAVVILGMDSVRNLLLTAFLRALHRTVGESTRDLFRHSVLTALAAKDLVETRNLGNRLFAESCYVAALLHDLGRLALIHREGPTYPPKGVGPDTSDDERLAAEHDAYGFTHAELGSAIAHRWLLPFEICDAILHHHHPASSTLPSSIAAVVHLADRLAKRDGDDRRRPPPDSVALRHAGWTLADFDRWAERLPALASAADDLARIVR